MDEQQQLTNAYHSNKLSHAYLFEGDDAQTMKQVAINFAKLRFAGVLLRFFRASSYA